MRSASALRMNCCSRVSGGNVDLEGEIAQVVTIRDGKNVRLDGYDQTEAALSAVGLEQ